MGEKRIHTEVDSIRFRHFMHCILDDLRALERMIDTGLIEKGVRRIGAEQEIFLVDRGGGPAPLALEFLKRLDHPQFTTELALFNLEANLSPRVFEGKALSELEGELNGLLGRVRTTAKELNAGVVLTGILPTLDQSHLGMESMTPIPRYRQLNDAMAAMRGGQFRCFIKGIDELAVAHDNVLFEACNTSFQVHFQVGADEFAKLYNFAQAMTAPVLAAAVNSPLVMGRRLWQETRVALFQQSVDERSELQLRRGRRPRVNFGDHWVNESVLEIFREDIARFRLVITTDVGEPSTTILDKGGIPTLPALRLHNGTVYRWNRACYGVHEGKAHLRIEVRALPAGPSVIDEIANAAFFFGLMCAVSEEHADIKQVMKFDDAKANFVNAARMGLRAKFHWMKGEEWPADELILQRLLPQAREGLKSRGVDEGDIERYLGVIEGRVRSGQTGAQWMLDSNDEMAKTGKAKAGERARALVKTLSRVQWSGKPVHEWPHATLDKKEGWATSFQTVGQVMTTDVFTVHPEDLVDLAASLMQWEHIRHVPVEDADGKLVGLVSHRSLLRLVSGGGEQSKSRVAVREIMKPDPIAVTPETTVFDAIALMRRHRVSCLPVTAPDGRLTGIVTEHDFVEIAARIFEDRLRREPPQ